jgi:signal transduction histidine kinase
MLMMMWILNMEWMPGCVIMRMRQPAASIMLISMHELSTQHRPVDLLRYGGLFTWFCAGIPLPLMYVIFPTPLSDPQYAIWWMLHGLFGLAYWHAMKALPGLWALNRRLSYLVLLTTCALGINIASESSLGGVLLLIVAGLLPWVMPSIHAISWLVGQNIQLTITITQIPDVAASDAAVVAGLFLGISLFAFMSSLVAMRQHQARDELRKVNSELRATQALLADNTRIAERVRIARELHDLIGHHLTALTLNLEVATHLVEGKAAEHVQQAHSLARLLLADVREVVSDMREDDKVDLAAALRTLVEGVPEPKIHLDLPSELAMTNPQRAQVLLRCAQEMITNSVRHAHARNLWIRLTLSADGLAMSARDDGRGVEQVRPGNGLSGMSERLKNLGGKLEIESQAGAGFSLHAWLPKEAIS